MTERGRELVAPDEIVWARDLDGTGSMHMCTPHCPGAVAYVRADLIVAAEIELPPPPSGDR